MEVLAFIVPLLVFVGVFIAMLPRARQLDRDRGGTPAGFRNTLVLIALLAVVAMAVVLLVPAGAARTTSLVAAVAAFVAAAVWNERRFGAGR